MPNGTKYYHLPVTVSTWHWHQMTWKVHFSWSMAEIPWKDMLDCLVLVISGIWAMIKGLILFAKLGKLWLNHAKSLQENRLLKIDALECNKHFKSHEFKVGQLVAVKNHLRNTFDTRFLSDYRIVKNINKCSLLIESPDGKTRKININDAKPVSAITAADNVLQEFKQSLLRRECTHPYTLHSSSM